MMKTVFLLLLVVLLSGCSSNQIESLLSENEQLKQQTAQLQNQVQTLKVELKKNTSDNSNQITINYQSYDFKRRFVQKQAKILALPRNGSIVLRTIEPNSIVEVFDAATADDHKLWLYVSVPVYDSPSNVKGWISEGDTTPYTKDNQKLLQSDVVIKKGSNVFNTSEFDKINFTNPEILDFDQRGRIEERKNGYVRIFCPGGKDLWVTDNQIVYPTIE